MRKRLFLSQGLVFLLFCGVVSLLSASPEIREEEILSHIRYLASPELQGRRAGTPGAEKSARYIAGLFRRWGLQPPPGQKSFYQTFAFTYGFRLGPHNLAEVEIGEERMSLKVGKDYQPLAFSENAEVTGPVVFVGYGIRGGDIPYNDYQGVSVKDKIALVMRYTPEGDNPHSPFFPYAPLRYKAMVAREQGAKAVIFVTGPESPSREEFPSFQADASFVDSGIPTIVVRTEVAEKMVSATGKDLREIQQEINRTKRPLSFDLPVKVHLKTEVVRERRKTANVIGYLPGSDPQLREEVVIIGAHYDHLGLGGEGSRARRPYGAIHYGADDNASGTAGVLELAEYFASRQPRPARSLLFIAFSGEEMGLLGSSFYVKSPVIPLEKTAAMINFDMIGRLRRGRLVTIGTGSSPIWKPLLQKANNPLGLRLVESESGFGASDQTPFYSKGIPVLFFFTGSHAEYHTPEDTWETINADGERKVLELAVRVVEAVANHPERPAFTRVPSTERMPGAFRVYLGTIPDYSEEVVGVRLTGVREGSPAEKAGLREGDIIVQVGGREIRNVYDYTYALADLEPGQPVTIVVVRGGKRVTLTVIPEKR